MAWCFALPQEGNLTCEIVFTSMLEGDLAGEPSTWRPAAGLRDLMGERSVVAARQVHSARVLRVDERHAGEAAERGLLGEADALVTLCAEVVLCVRVADCVPIGLVAREGPVAVVHAGWRGLVAGIVEETVEAMRDTGASHIGAVVGPCIGPECYEFGREQARELAEVFGSSVVVDDGDSCRVDLRACVDSALRRTGTRVMHRVEACTGCDPVLWSHRRDGTTSRQGVLVWRASVPTSGFASLSWW
ncbi:MAG: hypothetical protein KatS3mg008_0078 [Acidimicrobiales bacterium]|nr:MAG: hypothetical protein KatS3mg008_0078 [Acidimicrobiales bacterium]